VTDAPPLSREAMRAPAMKSSELVARYLVDYIIANDLQEGTPLAGEREMAESLEVGRATIREALRLLETRGAITIRKGAKGGPVVRRPRATDVSEALTLALQFEGGVLEDVFEAREMIECLVVERAAGRITKRQLKELDECVSRARAGAADQRVFVAESQLFHHLINDAAGNLAIQVFNQTLHVVANRAVAPVTHSVEHRLQVVDAHAEVLEALRSRDPEAAVAAMRNHVRSSRAYWNKAAGDLGRISITWLQRGNA
jgi:DNA-binding FadR family transcriptional regulator